MDRETLERLLEAVAAGAVAPEQALARLARAARRRSRLRQASICTARCAHGGPEAVFCPGKTAEQVVAIVQRLAAHHDNVLATRAEPAVAAALLASGLPCRVPRRPRASSWSPAARDGVGLIVVVSAGTADLPVAEEAALVAEAHGQPRRAGVRLRRRRAASAAGASATS